MKTIKQIADELGVSKTAVRKKIENLGLRSSLHKNGNQFLVDENAEKLLKQSFSHSETESKSKTDSETSSQTENGQVSILISMLQAELDAKNEQIAHLQKLLDQEQQLRMVTEQKMLALEDKKEEPPKKRWQFWK